MDRLQQFTQDESTRESLREYLLEFMKDKAGTEAMQGKDVSGYKEAKETINKAFDTLVDKYKPKEKKKYINQAV